MNLKNKMHILKQKKIIFKKGMCACKEVLLSHIYNVPHFITKIFKPRVYKNPIFTHTHTYIYINIMVTP